MALVELGVPLALRARLLGFLLHDFSPMRLWNRLKGGVDSTAYFFLDGRPRFITWVTARSTFPMAFPSTVPTARPSCLALRVVAAGTDESRFDFRTTFLAIFCTGFVLPIADLVLRLMT